MELGASHNQLGLLLAGLGKRPEADEQHRKALAVREKLVADFPAVPVYRRELAQSHNNLGLLLAELGKGPEAEEHVRRAQAIQEKLVADFPAVPRYRQDLALSHNNLGLLLGGLKKGPAAEQQYRTALAIQEKLVADFPAVAQHRVDLGGSYCNFGILVRNSGHPDESLEWFEKAIRTLSTVYEQDRRLVPARTFLRNSHWSQAETYDRLRKFAEANKHWAKAIELSSTEGKPAIRSARATSRLQAGQVAEAVAEVAELTKNPFWDAGSWYNFACLCAIASGNSADKKQEYADRAMDLLQKAVRAGFNDAAQMAKDPDLDPIRARDEFKKLIERLGMKSPEESDQKRRPR